MEYKYAQSRADRSLCLTWAATSLLSCSVIVGVDGMEATYGEFNTGLLPRIQLTVMVTLSDLNFFSVDYITRKANHEKKEKQK